MMYPSTTTALLLSSLASVASAASAPHVTLSSGSVKGSTCMGTGVQRFRGIPYAQSTAGKGRFMPPQPFNGSLGSDDSPFDASHISSPCPQFSEDYSEASPASSEDCLTVNVYAPPTAKSGSKLPVKVWAYGGSNEGGAVSDPLYNACNLATDAVVVEFNYRLGALGFLSLEGAGIQGNMAIQDTLAALHWVQDNVGSFGGDKSRVVMFGQSAGADNTFVISTLPQAKGLISGAVTQSGDGYFTTTPDIAQEIGKSFAEALNCTAGKDQLSCLQSLPMEAIKTVYSNIPAVNKSTAVGQVVNDYFGIEVPRALNMANPVHDGKIIPEEPLRAGPKVPILAGAAERDASLFAVTTLLGQANGTNLTSDAYDEFVKLWGPTIGPRVAERYPLSMFNVTGSTNDAVYAAASTICTLAGYICPSYYVMQSAESVGTPGYSYRFNNTPSCPFSEPAQLNYQPFPSPELRDVFGPTHISDVPFVFGNLAHMPLDNGTCNSTADEYALSAEMRAAWTAMASGSPGTDKLKWPRFNTCEQKGVIFQRSGGEVTKLDFTECQFWGKVWNELSGAKIPFLGANTTCSSNGGSPSSTNAAPTGTSGQASGVPHGAASGSRKLQWSYVSGFACVLTAVLFAI